MGDVLEAAGAHLSDLAEGGIVPDGDMEREREIRNMFRICPPRLRVVVR